MTLPPPRRVLVTVGSTKFDALIHHTLKNDTLDVFLGAGFSVLRVQAGNSTLPPGWDFVPVTADYHNLRVEIFKFRPSMSEEITASDLIISHAGSGTILECLRAGKRLIVMPNDTLLDNHQTELAEALDERGHLVATTTSGLNEMIAKLSNERLVPFPEPDGGGFGKLIAEELGL